MKWKLELERNGKKVYQNQNDIMAEQSINTYKDYYLFGSKALVNEVYYKFEDRPPAETLN